MPILDCLHHTRSDGCFAGESFPLGHCQPVRIGPDHHEDLEPDPIEAGYACHPCDAIVGKGGHDRFKRSLRGDAAMRPQSKALFGFALVQAYLQLAQTSDGRVWIWCASLSKKRPL